MRGDRIHVFDGDEGAADIRWRTINSMCIIPPSASPSFP